ncbi:MAG: MaoC family dehydratase [Burkholderiales bacterium]|nr:MaoC family dehydratase [Burkholderiales bacterium]
MKRYAHLSDLQPLVGQEIGVSDWFVIDQARIDRFAEATGDDQWIHVDPVRAAAGPFGATIAHGFLTLSMLPAMGMAAFEIGGLRMSVNYGLDRVRFPAPVRAGSRLRGRFVLREFQPIEGGAQLVVECTMELDGSSKPACVALAVSRRFV